MHVATAHRNVATALRNVATDHRNVDTAHRDIAQNSSHMSQITHISQNTDTKGTSP